MKEIIIIALILGVANTALYLYFEYREEKWEDEYIKRNNGDETNL
jgi:hypothetical protein